jgi:DNA-directed RNA polymerase specialized sigma24 family protein
LTTDYAAGTRRLQKFFTRRGFSPAEAKDLTQDTWVRYVVARNRGTLRYGGLEPLGTMARYVLLNFYSRKNTCEEVTRTGDFGEEAGLIQLQPEGPEAYKQHKSSRSPELKTQIRADREAGLTVRELSKRHSVPVGSVHRILAEAA